MEIGLILIALSGLLALVSPLVFAAFLFSRDSNEETDGTTTEG